MSEKTHASIVSMTDEQYHAHSALSKSKLAEFADSSAVYHARHIAKTMPPKSSSRQMELGDVIHKCILTDARLDDIAVEIPRECYNAAGSLNTRGSEYKMFAAENADSIMLRSADYEAAKYIIHGDPRVSIESIIRFLGSDNWVKEKAIFWTNELTGLDCRCKPDAFLPKRDATVCVDLKVTPCVSPSDWKRQVKRFRYWMQDRHYSAGLLELTGKPCRFYFLLIEPQEPFRVLLRYIDPQNGLGAADSEYRRQLGRFAECQRSGNWADDWSELIQLSDYDVGAPVSEEPDDLNWGE